MDRKNVIGFLEQYNILQKTCQITDEQMFSIAALLREIKREEGCEEGDNVKRRVGKYCADLTDELSLLKIRKRLLMHRISLIESAVNTLPKNERRVIERFFLSPDKRYAADELMEELECEKTQIYRIRTRALEMIGDIIANIPTKEYSQ